MHMQIAFSRHTVADSFTHITFALFLWWVSYSLRRVSVFVVTFLFSHFHCYAILWAILLLRLQLDGLP